MVREDAAQGVLSWLRRRSLIRYAVSLGIPAEEARHIVRTASAEQVGERGPAGEMITGREAMRRAIQAAHQGEISHSRRLAFAVMFIIANSVLLTWLLS